MSIKINTRSYGQLPGMSRRSFLKGSAMGAAGVAAASVMGGLPSPALAKDPLVFSFWPWGSEIVNEDLIRLRYEASIRPGYQESYVKMFPAPRQRHIDAMAQSEEALRAIPHATLIVHGRDDRIIPLDSSIRLNHLIPRSQLHVYGQCGHWTQIEHNARFCNLVTDFLAELAG